MAKNTQKWIKRIERNAHDTAMSSVAEKYPDENITIRGGMIAITMTMIGAEIEMHYNSIKTDYMIQQINRMG